MKTTTNAIAKALARAKRSGGIGEADMEAVVRTLTDAAMALEVDANDDERRTTRAASDLLSDLAVAIDDAAYSWGGSRS